MLNNQSSRKKGFTLLELLIVIAILAILSAVAIFVLNPAETLREARDAQRISDLATIKTAIALYITKTTSTVYLGNSGANTSCRSGAWASGDTINYSAETAISDATLDGGSGSIPTAATSTTPNNTDGTGWIPVNLAGLVGGSPISSMPLDPTNNFNGGSASAVTSTDLFYRYACDSSDLTFEVNANFESTSMATRETKDGGNNSNLYESGTKLSILGTGTDF